MIDTVTIQLSTIKADSIITSATNNALVGYYRHPIMGGQGSKSYFSLNYPTNYSWDSDKQTFDSLVVFLRPNTYYIGDTAHEALFNIHPLLDEISTHDDGKLYNTSSFSFDALPVAQKQFRPYPVSKEEIEIKIDNSYALEMIEFLNEYENHVDKETLFKEAFKGFVFDCDTTITKSAIGFSVSDTTSFMRLYSHISGLEKEEISTDFSLATSTNQFNELYSNDDQVVFNQITDGKAVLAEQNSDGIVLLQSGSGFKFRVDFPTLNNLLELKNKGHIVKAELRLKPDMNVMQSADLPAQVYIGDIYRANDIWGYLTDSNNNPLTSTLSIDYLYHENTYYAFDLTNYLNSRLQEEVVDTDQGLVITLPDTNMGSSFTWLAVNGTNHAKLSSQILLYYYYYDTE